MTLRALPVQTDDQIELVRIIRNQTAHGFSNYTDQISEAAHIAFWEREKPLAWVYLDELGRPVGFGLLRYELDRDHWITVVAVLPEFGGRGYGKWITRDIVSRAPGRVWATARRDNPAAVALHVAEDWETYDGPDQRLVYFRGRQAIGDKAQCGRSHTQRLSR